MTKQLKLNLYQGTHGGRRPKAGRKRLHSSGVSHTKREVVNKRTPLHINFKFSCQIKNKACLKLLKKSIQNAQKHGLRIIHFSLQHNHIHLISEADDNKTLTVGMRALTISFSKGLKKGRIQLERYHLHVLKTLQETKNVIEYVIFNQQKHSKNKASRIDGYSSILYLAEFKKLIRNFARKSRMQLTLGKREEEVWELTPGESYLLNRGLRELINPL